ncbi:MAG: acyl-ACP--UDP-N-acetylglucosamine O-acyltransferase [Gammaproteobacteria bacterium]|nr:acyl-ACP--UDP-N-acetylglucosamine O-acyltransferase [Gammaproteobacteria bacterium]
MIHSTAIVDPAAEIASDVSIGPYSIIGADVRIGRGTWIGPHVVIEGPTRIGENNKIYQFCSLGDVPQDKKFQGEPSELVIGDRNVIREYCTMNRGTAGGGGLTRIGSDNWIMAYVHIAHDCQLGDHNILANGTTLAGHVNVESSVTFGAFTVIHQFCCIGAHSFTAMGTVVFKDVPPFLMVAGWSAKPHGLNTEGLRRRDFDPEVVLELKRAYKTVYKQGTILEKALAALEPSAQRHAEVGHFVRFIQASTRGIVR